MYGLISVLECFWIGHRTILVILDESHTNMIRYVFMTCSLHVFHVFHEMFVMDLAYHVSIIVQFLYENIFHYGIYHSKNLQPVLGSVLKVGLEKCLRSRDCTL